MWRRCKAAAVFPLTGIKLPLTSFRCWCWSETVLIKQTRWDGCHGDIEINELYSGRPATGLILNTVECECHTHYSGDSAKGLIAVTRAPTGVWQGKDDSARSARQISSAFFDLLKTRATAGAITADNKCHCACLADLGVLVSLQISLHSSPAWTCSVT